MSWKHLKHELRQAKRDEYFQYLADCVQCGWTPVSYKEYFEQQRKK